MQNSQNQGQKGNQQGTQGFEKNQNMNPNQGQGQSKNPQQGTDRSTQNSQGAAKGQQSFESNDSSRRDKSFSTEDEELDENEVSSSDRADRAPRKDDQNIHP